MLSIRLSIVVLFILFLGAGQIFTQETKLPDVAKGVFWSDAASGVEVYLVPKVGNTYRLTVISSKEVKVTYHTSINSIEKVAKELAPVLPITPVRYYDFEHYFSKMTIWMSLEFTVDGKQIPSLSRAFHDSIFQLAPSNMYLGPNEKEGSVTVSGCVKEGVECLVLESFTGNEKYSIVAGSKLQVGAAYRITGSIVEVTICQYGKALRPSEITKLDRKCT